MSQALPAPTVDRRYQVFVSSTYRDLIEARASVMHALMVVNAIPAGMELFPAADDDAWTLIKKAIEESDYYIVIIGGKYGSTMPGGISYTEREYDHAVSVGKPVMAFLHKCPEELKASQYETDPAKRARLEAFRTKAERKHCNYWTDGGDLTAKVVLSYTQMTRQHPAIGWVRGDYAKTLQEIERTAKLQQRVSELEAELAAVRRQLDDGTSQYAQGDDHVTLRFTVRAISGKSEMRHEETTWNSVFRVAASALLHTADPTEVSRQLAVHLLCLGLKEGDGTTLGAAGLDSYSLVVVQRQLLALKLIAIASAGNEVVWHLTDKGQSMLASLLAIKRPSVKQEPASQAMAVSGETH